MGIIDYSNAYNARETHTHHYIDFSLNEKIILHAKYRYVGR